MMTKCLFNPGRPAAWLVAAGLILVTGFCIGPRDAVANKLVTFYPTYGFVDGSQWRIPLRYWVHKRADTVRRLVAKGARKVLQKRADIASLSDQQKRLFMTRAEDFVADSESNEQVEFHFDNDPTHTVYKLHTSNQKGVGTDRNGLASGWLTLTNVAAMKLLAEQQSNDGWLTFHARSDNHYGVGSLRLIEPEGLSVISDIDDTIKVTEITAGEKAVLENTFFREFRAVECMQELYAALPAASAFHYVSGGPWQLYTPLAEFLLGFPAGSVHMKNARTNPFERESYKDFWRLFTLGTKQVTFNQKIAQISKLLDQFPNREFILIGDSGESDPEIFRQIKQLRGRQVREIRIRVIPSPGETDLERFSGMTIIQGTTYCQ